MNNFWGVLAWLIALTMWAFALPWARRWSYDIFIGVHQLHWGFWFFSCAHYNTIVSYAMPSNKTPRRPRKPPWRPKVAAHRVSLAPHSLPPCNITL